MNEPTLFDYENPREYREPIIDPRERQRRMARQSDPQTSWEAIPNRKALTKTKQAILALLRGYPLGLTSSQVANMLDIDKGSSSKRLGDLEHEQYVEVFGTRLSDRGKKSSVYRIKQ